MVFILLIAIGIFIGYRLGSSRAATLIMALIFLSALAIQVIHVLTTHNQAFITMLPFVAGSIVLLAIVLGMWVRSMIAKRPEPR